MGSWSALSAVAVLLLGVLAGPASAATVPSPYAAADGTDDLAEPSGDTYLPQGDITSIRVVHTATALKLSLTTRVPHDLEHELVWIQWPMRVGPGDSGGYRAHVVYRHGAVEPRLVQGYSQNAVTCTLRASYDPAAARFKVRIPTSCLGNPGAVSVSAGVLVRQWIDGQRAVMVDYAPDEGGTPRIGRQS